MRIRRPLFLIQGNEEHIRGCKMTEPMRISPEEARQKRASGSALLVCAYDSDEKFNRIGYD